MAHATAFAQSETANELVRLLQTLDELSTYQPLRQRVRTMPLGNGPPLSEERLLAGYGRFLWLCSGRAGSYIPALEMAATCTRSIFE